MMLAALCVIVLSISIMDIRTRYVSPQLILPLTLGVCIGGVAGLWPLSVVGGLVAFSGTLLLGLPLGDVIGFGLCGLLAGPTAAALALMICALGLFLVLRFLGHRLNLVQHPFFPYLGGTVLIFSRLFS